MKVAFKMKLKPGMVAEYKKRHDEIWPELVELLKKMESEIILFFWMKKQTFYLLCKD